ncbi:LacI family DNA-binding transcriptional regulator [Actinoplanes sp. NPDC051851]|uniref:LacI family DNA-binding transcriptional regulator n=1 Tax=Actinoplanes sp. NPDC051851 TaxID=3154753 RepID=UPI003418E6E9
MKDVARVAGVSLKTVSRVVNGEGSVSAPLAAQVNDAIATLNYRLDHGASTLRRGDHRTGTIGLMVEDVANPFFAALHRAVEDVARLHDTHVLIGSVGACPEREGELARAFITRRADGLIIVPLGPDGTSLDDELHTDTPVVFVDRPGYGIAADTVLSTNVAGAAEATRHLIRNGHTRIACIGDRPVVPTARQRRAGYLSALREAGVRPDPALIVEGVTSTDAAVRAVLELLGHDDPPTALFTTRNTVTTGAVRALRALDRQDRVALVGFDDFPLADLLDPPVTVIAQDPVTMGRTAAQALFRRINGDAGPPTRFAIPTRLIPRGSGELRPR